jgi:diguanylate cyclase (GGDEF)-like protein
MPRFLRDLVALALAVIVTWLDIITGGIPFSVFYIAPLTAFIWNRTRLAAAVASLGIVALRLGSTVANHGLDGLVMRQVWSAVIWLAYYFLFSLLVLSLRIAHQRLSELARRDPLTGLLNRRTFLERLDEERRRALRSGHPLTLAYFDLDGFKSVNDTLGHEAGDTLLREVAAACTASLRSTDTVGRLGGDEFCLILPETDTIPARTAIAKTFQLLSESMRRTSRNVTFSFGCRTFLAIPASAEAMIADADRLMYDAKHAGGNRIEAAASGGTSGAS